MPKKNITELWLKNLKFEKYLATDDAFKHLTAEQKAKTKQVDVFDDPAKGGVPGLFLRLSSGGTKAWRVVWYPKGQKGKARTHGLKRYPIYGLEKARTEAKKFLVDPEEAIREEVQDTFQSVWDNFLKRHAKDHRSRDQSDDTIKYHVLPVWKHKRFIDIDRTEVTRLLDKVEDKSGKKQADVVLSILRSVFSWFQKRNANYTSPIVRGMARTNPADSRRKRKLSDDEIRVLWSVTKTIPKYGPIVRLCLLTAQRRTKIATIKRADIKGDVWTIATEHREKNNAEQIKLPKLALDIISAQPRLNSTDYLFPAGRGLGPFNAFDSCFPVLIERMQEQLPDMPKFVLHDLRRTARSLMGRAGVRREVAERCLGHKVGNQIEQTYDVYEYEIEKTKAFDALANLISAILDPAAAPNVIPLRA
jgi:integrase